MPAYLEDGPVVQRWVQVDLVVLKVGMNLTPAGGTRLEVNFDQEGVLIVRQVSDTTQELAFSTLFPWTEITRVEFSLKP